MREDLCRLRQSDQVQQEGENEVALRAAQSSAGTDQAELLCQRPLAPCVLPGRD